MEPIFTIIKQDLEVAKKAVEEENFDFILFTGNRIIMNLLVKEEIKLMLLGYMIRDLGSELRRIKRNRKDAFIDAKKESITYLTNLETQIANENYESKIYWENYYEIETKLRKYLLSKIEGSIYDEQSEFSKEFTIKILDIFYSKKNDIYTLKDLITNYLFELARNFNEHGGKESLVIYLVFKAYDEYCRYLNNERDLSNKRRKKIELKIGEYIKNIYELKSSISNMDELYKKSSVIINDLGRNAKICYLSGELPPGTVERELELPEDVKQKIGETIMQSLKDRDKTIAK
jgi:hypothetical protein